MALPLTVGTTRYPGIKIHDARIIRLLEVLLHGGNTVGGWTAKQIHSAILTAFQLFAKAYGLNQLRYDPANSKAMVCWIARTTVTLTASQQKVFRWRSCWCSSTSASAAPCQQPLSPQTRSRSPPQ